MTRDTEPAQTPDAASTPDAAPTPDAGQALDAAGTDLGERTDQRLDTLDGLPVDEHVAVYDEAHRDLRDALSDAAKGGGT